MLIYFSYVFTLSLKMSYFCKKIRLFLSKLHQKLMKDQNFKIEFSKGLYHELYSK